MVGTSAELACFDICSGEGFELGTPGATDLGRDAEVLVILRFVESYWDRLCGLCLEIGSKVQGSTRSFESPQNGQKCSP